jgi:hypothetical protein
VDARAANVPGAGVLLDGALHGLELVGIVVAAAVGLAEWMRRLDPAPPAVATG